MRSNKGLKGSGKSMSEFQDAAAEKHEEQSGENTHYGRNKMGDHPFAGNDDSDKRGNERIDK
jgi:hypothetical protein